MPPLLALVLAAAIVIAGVPTLGLGLRAALVLASAAPIGAVLLLAIARVTGADWPAAGRPSGALGWLAAFGVLATLAPVGVATPPHLALWSHPVGAAARAGVALAALGWAGGRLRAGAGTTFAGLTLAGYAWLVTPVAADWLLPAAPGHPVSAIGMMLFLLQFGAGCAAALPASRGGAQRDLALLLVAALLGLCYLGFMDYLIVWFGNLPARVPFYLDRSGWLAVAALPAGAASVGAVVVGRLALAAAMGAAALTLFVLWWVAPAGLGLLVALAAALAAALIPPQEPAYG